MFAKVHNSRVGRIEDWDKIPTMHPDLSMRYFPCDETVKAGYTYDYVTKTYSPPEPIIIPNDKKIESINHEACKRIENVMPNWMICREVTGGKDIPTTIKDEAKRLRTVSNNLCVSLPDDWTDDSHWAKPPKNTRKETKKERIRRLKNR